MNFYVMKTDAAYAGGLSEVRRFRSEAAARKEAERLNKLSPVAHRVMNETEYREWHDSEIMPYYRER